MEELRGQASRERLDQIPRILPSAQQAQRALELGFPGGFVHEPMMAGRTAAGLTQIKEPQRETVREKSVFIVR